MPCNGVAVATGQVATDLAKLIFALPSEGLKQAIAGLLRSKFPALSLLKIEPLPWSYDLGVTDFGFKIGFLSHAFKQSLTCILKQVAESL